MTDRPFITPQDVSLLARPCYADEAKVLAYIYEAEQNNIKPKIGDDLFLRLKDGENPLLLEGGTYEKNGKRYQLNGIKKALAYYAYSRLLESGSVDLTRQGVVNRRSDAANAVDEDNIIKISRETYAIADRYMQEVMDYLGAGEQQTTQRTSVGLIGASEGASRSRSRQQQTSLGAIDPNKYATKEYVDGKIADLDIPEVGDFETKEEAEKKLKEAKRYTDEVVGNIDIPELPTLAKVAESGSYKDLKDKPTIPSVEGLEQYVDEKVGAVQTQVGDVNEVLESIINGGDMNPTAKKKAVTFYDYDGTIRYSYTADEFLALTEMPPLPTQQGLICQEWNWSYEDAMEYVSEYGVLDVGATYITDDGKTRLYIRIAAEGRMDVPLYFQQTIANGVTIDWGDGSTEETIDGTGAVNTIHRYNSIGNYMITLDVSEGELNLGRSTSDCCLFGIHNSTGTIYTSMLRKIEIGRGLTNLGNYALPYCRGLQSITLPNTVTNLAMQSLYYCSLLKAVVIPKSIPSLTSNVFSYCIGLKYVICHNNLIFAGNSIFSNTQLSSYIISEGVKIIRISCFLNNRYLGNLIIPKNVTTIDNGAFQNCSGMAYYDFSHHTAIPTLANTNAFTDIPSDCKIIVPDALYDEWIAATNWSAYATYIIKKSEWDNLKQGGSL